MKYSTYEKFERACGSIKYVFLQYTGNTIILKSINNFISIT